MANIASYRALRSEPEYLKLVLANVVNRFGDSIDAIAFSWMMYQITASASMMALIVGLNFLPTILLQPFAGALADRLRKKPVMVWMDVGRSLLTLGSILLLVAGALTPGLLILITMSHSVLEALRGPASAAIVPKLLGEAHYDIGVALDSTLSRVTELAGLALAGGVIAWIGVSGALLIDMATFVLSAVIIALIRVREEPSAEKVNVRAVLGGFTDGLRTIRHSPVLMALAFLGMLMNFGLVPLSVFGTPYVVDDLHMGPEMMSGMEIALVAGMALGSFLTPRLKRFKGRTQIVASGLGVSVALCLLALIPRLASQTLRLCAVLGAAAAMGVGVGVLNVVFHTAFLRLVPKEKMGAIKGMLSAVLCASMPIGSFLCSAASSALTVTQTMLIAGGFSILLYLGMLWIKPLHEV